MEGMEDGGGEVGGGGVLVRKGHKAYLMQKVLRETQLFGAQEDYPLLFDS